jgi:stage II sporulation protein P
MRQPPDVHLPVDTPQILIIHTHGTEAYTASPGSEYTESDEYRTTDTNYNVVKLGELLQQELSAQGLHVIHDRGLYDYPRYTGSYDRSAAAVEQWLQQYPGISVVIDLHRDALGSGDAVYKTRAELSAEPSAQVMLLIGTGENGLPHPHWQENFKLALRLQDAMNRSTPTLARPIDLVSERYNQHYTTGSMILEVGSSGNTLPEAMCAIRLFARAAGPVFLSLVEPTV